MVESAAICIEEIAVCAGGTGHKVRFSGFEEWTFGDDTRGVLVVCIGVWLSPGEAGLR